MYRSSTAPAESPCSSSLRVALTRMFEPSLVMLAFTTLRSIGSPYFGLGSPAGLLYSYEGTAFRAGTGAAEADPATPNAHSPAPMIDAFFMDASSCRP